MKLSYFQPGSIFKVEKPLFGWHANDELPCIDGGFCVQIGSHLVHLGSTVTILQFNATVNGTGDWYLCALNGYAGPGSSIERSIKSVDIHDHPYLVGVYIRTQMTLRVRRSAFMP